MGGFANVYRALWNDRAVAIKVIRAFSSSQHGGGDPIESAFLREIVVSRQVDHPNVQPFCGVDRHTFAPHLGLVSPWQPYGNLNEAVESFTRDGVPVPCCLWASIVAFCDSVVPTLTTVASSCKLRQAYNIFTAWGLYMATYVALTFLSMKIINLV